MRDSEVSEPVAAAQAEGGQASIRPPSKVKSIEVFKPLAAGFDTVYLALEVSWKDGKTFKLLEEYKQKAVGFDKEFPLELTTQDGMDRLTFNVQPYGFSGYTWLLSSREYYLKVFNNPMRSQRPGVLVEIRSEPLWRLGFQCCVDRILRLLKDNGAFIHNTMASRVDPCIDVLFPAELWKPDLREYAVTRAVCNEPYFRHNTLTGFRWGGNQFKGRLYDKPLEIKQKSKKFWMYDIWNLEEVPEGHHIIRIEFELHREALKSLGLKTIWDVMNRKDGLWAYCTQDWLKFQDRPGLHHTQRKTFPWWESIQKGFSEQTATPLIRHKAIMIDINRLGQQLFGYYSSLVAATAIDAGLAEIDDVSPKDHLRTILDIGDIIGMTKEKFTRDVRRKLAKFQMVMLERIEQQRKAS
jgi:hypothetical protein